jgi:hypothetical protein
MAYSARNGSPSLSAWPLGPEYGHQEISERIEEAAAEEDVVQGRIFWLPAKEELPFKAVRRAHGKGAVEEGIYNHPIVAISRPAEEPTLVHFHLVRKSQTRTQDDIVLTNV